jgi:outer membrane protein TolC
VLAIASPILADSLTIRFSELDDWAMTKSLGAADISGTVGLVKAERDFDLRTSNPELSFDRQNVDRNKESQVTLGKTFEMPWVTMKRRAAWSDRLQSAELSADERRAQLLSELRAGYVSLQSFDAHLSRLTHIREVLTDASHVATSRHTEGHLSGVENHLIQMTVISLQVEHQRAMSERRNLEIDWRALIGSDPAKPLRLATAVTFRPVTLGTMAEYAAGLEQRPGHQSRILNEQGLAKQAGAERARLLPSFGLYGGYKSVDPDYTGYVMGVSLSLPLLNTNGATARKFEIERQMARTETERYRTVQYGRLASLVTSIGQAQETLALSQDHFEEDAKALDDMLFAYEEGWLTLSELLNGVQIEIAGLSDYYSHLAQYYRDIFELEAITGRRLVQFE